VYVEENVSAHVSFRGCELCRYAVRYDQSSFGTIVDIPTLVQIRSNGVLSRHDRLWDGIVIIKVLTSGYQVGGRA
jgi:hypothetical protein